MKSIVELLFCACDLTDGQRKETFSIVEKEKRIVSILGTSIEVVILKSVAVSW